MNIIVIDDDRDFLDIIRGRLHSFGFKQVRTEYNPIQAASGFETGAEFDIALIDISMPEMGGIELLERIKSVSPETECIMVTAVNEARVAVECLKKGAYDYLVKPVSEEDLSAAVRRTMERKRLLDILEIETGNILPELKHQQAFQPIVTQSRKVLKVLKEAELHAVSNDPILITGESGTGKELLARAIHDVSPRSDFPFTPINMASVAPTLFEAEFFGHAKGAFTGADQGRQGYLEHTHRGTLFLDEIGDLSPELQGKLMRILQGGEYIRLGNNKSQKADIRFIAATNVDLDRLMTEKTFRKDLYYRIRGGRLHLPPLRERKGDIPLLINRFIDEYCDRKGSTKTGADHCKIEEDAISLLLNYHYPGNIRELRSIIRSALNLAQGKPVSADFLPDNLKKRKPLPDVDCTWQSETIPSLKDVEKSHILKVYKHTGKNKSQTARILGIGLNTLRRKLKSYKRRN